MVNACKMASAKRKYIIKQIILGITAILPYFPYTKHSKQKHRGCITAKLLGTTLHFSLILTISKHASSSWRRSYHYNGPAFDTHTRIFLATSRQSPC
jgi:phosphoribosylpyrophosphate synthetase